MTSTAPKLPRLSGLASMASSTKLTSPRRARPACAAPSQSMWTPAAVPDVPVRHGREYRLTPGQSESGLEPTTCPLPAGVGFPLRLLRSSIRLIGARDDHAFATV